MNLWTAASKALHAHINNPLATYYLQEELHKGKVLTTVVGDTGTVQTALAVFVNDPIGATRWKKQQEKRQQKAQQPTPQPFNAPKVA